MMVERLKHEGTSHSSGDLLTICVKMGAIWSAQVFRQAGDTPSGPGAFLAHVIFTELNCRCGGEGGCWRCEWLCGEVFGVQGRCGVFFQTCNKTHSDRLPIVDSPECWGMVSCNW